MSAIEELVATVATLRGPDGCPWDREQDHHSLTRCLVEECSELLDAIDREDFDHMLEELGDVLVQVVFHAQLAEEDGRFGFEDVVRGIHEKLVRRHPHVFGENRLSTSSEVITLWETIKAGEKAGSGPIENRIFKDLPPRLPALTYASDIWKRIRKRGIDPKVAVDESAVQETAQTLSANKAGRLLFELAAACQDAGIDPEDALRRHAAGVVTQLETA